MWYTVTHIVKKDKSMMMLNNPIFGTRIERDRVEKKGKAIYILLPTYTTTESLIERREDIFFKLSRKSCVQFLVIINVIQII